MWNKNNLPPCTPGSGSAQTWRTHWRIHPHPAAASSWPSWVPVKRSKTVRMVEKKDALLHYSTELRKKKVSHELLFPINYQKLILFFKNFLLVCNPSIP